jgi:hypothetical protein
MHKPKQLPMGVITENLWPVYKRAYLKPNPDGSLPPVSMQNEHETSQFVENLCAAVLLVKDDGTREDGIYLNSQVPPHSESGLRADQAVKYVNVDDEPRIICFNECKRPAYTRPFQLREIEVQVRKYCRAWLAHPSNMKYPFVYAWTSVGTRACFWMVHREVPGLEPLWEVPTFGEWQAYKDWADPVDGPWLKQMFKAMLQYPPDRTPANGGAFTLRPLLDPRKRKRISSEYLRGVDEL